MALSIIAQQNLEHAKRQYLRAKKVYDQGDTVLMSDGAFNKLEDSIRKADPKWGPLRDTGTRVADKKTEVELLAFMPSLNKMYPEAVPKFFKRREIAKITRWMILDKYDGTALQLAYKDGVPYKLITRGNGELGGDISFFIPWLVKLKRIPAKITNKQLTILRIEGIMKKEVYEAKYSLNVLSKKEGGWDNIRNGINGVFNRKEQHPALKDIDLVILGFYGAPMQGGLPLAKKWGFTTARYNVVEHQCSAEELTKLLEKRRANSEYEMDGLVLAPMDWKFGYATNDKPKQSIAFKFNDDEGAEEVKVVKIIWQKTRLKRWIPKIYITPIKIDGVMVKHATLHNATWMTERGINVGAIIKVLRGGGVIPKVVGVVKRAKAPSVPPEAYEVKGKHYVMLEHDQASEVRGLVHFFKVLKIEQLAAKTLDRMYSAGLTSPADYVQLAVLARKRDAAAAARFQKAGLGQVESSKKMKEISRVLDAPVNLKLLMAASGCFVNGGMGTKKLAQLESAGISMRALCNMTKQEIWNEVGKVRGFKGATIEVLVAGIEAFRKWYRPMKGMLTIDGELPKPKVVKKGTLQGVMIAFTSYRSPEQEKLIEDNGGYVVAYGPKMNVLLYKQGAKFVDKIEKAGSKAMTWETFTKRFNIRGA